MIRKQINTQNRSALGSPPLFQYSLLKRRANADTSARTNTSRWCVDSGANRDLCRDLNLFGGRARPKTIRIGEAGLGHTFESSAEGPIALRTNGRGKPLLNRVIYADQITDNIMSVPEAVNAGYTVVFNREGVDMYHHGEVEMKAAPVLQGKRDPRTHLFFIEFPHTVSGAKAGTQALQPSRQPIAPINGTATDCLSESPSPAPRETLVSMMVQSHTSAISQGTDESTSHLRELHRRRSRGEEDCTLPMDGATVFLARTYHEYKCDYDLWHPRLSHINPRLARVAKLDLKEWPRKNHCDDCEGSYISLSTMASVPPLRIYLGQPANTSRATCLVHCCEVQVEPST